MEHTDFSRSTITAVHMRNLNCALSEKHPHISLGWGLLGDLGDIAEISLGDTEMREWAAAELEEKYADAYSKFNNNQKSGALRIIKRMVLDMHPGDIVIFCDSAYSNRLHFGVIVSPYYYGCLYGQDQDYMHHMKVCWIASRTYKEFSETLDVKYLGRTSLWSMDEYRDQILKMISKELDANGAETESRQSYEKIKVVQHPEVTDMRMLKRNADAGDMQAMVQLGICYEYGIGVREDGTTVKANCDMAKELYDRACRVSSGKYGPAQYHLGLCYYHLRGVRTDSREIINENKRKGITELTKAARCGDVRAQCFIANRCIYSGTQTSCREAMGWYNMAAKTTPIAEYKLHECYRYGLGTDVKYRKADDLYHMYMDNDVSGDRDGVLYTDSLF